MEFHPEAPLRFWLRVLRLDDSRGGPRESPTVVQLLSLDGLAFLPNLPRVRFLVGPQVVVQMWCRLSHGVDFRATERISNPVSM